jgi:hypothetical protein
MLGIYRTQKEEDVKGKTLVASFLLVFAGLALTGYAPAQGAGTGKVTVLNPVIASSMVKRIPLSPRLDTLEGKTLYMVDVNWGGPDAAYSVYEEMQDWFAKNMPGVKTVIRRKKGAYSQDDPELWKEIAKNGQAAIVGISG